MAGFIPMGLKGGVNAMPLLPGDLLLAAESVAGGALTTVGAGTVTGAMIATGIVRRTGPTGAYTDTFDSAANILAALAGNSWAASVVPGASFRLLYINTVAQAMTFAGGQGMVSGVGTLNVAASLVREYLITILNAMNPTTVPATATLGSAAVTFGLLSNQVALGIGAASAYNQISEGATITWTGVFPAGTTVLGVTAGQGGITGVTASGTATAAAVGAITFGPTVQIDSLRSSTL